MVRVNWADRLFAVPAYRPRRSFPRDDKPFIGGDGGTLRLSFCAWCLVST